MSHCITAVIVKGAIDTTQTTFFDLQPVSLTNDLTLFHLDMYYSEYWAFLMKIDGRLEWSSHSDITLPNNTALVEIMRKISGTQEPLFAIIKTEYFGGLGEQWANVFSGEKNIDPDMRTINQALHVLGVKPAPGMDAFDTIGLGNIRHDPEYLSKYVALCDQHNL